MHNAQYIYLFKYNLKYAVIQGLSVRYATVGLMTNSLLDWKYVVDNSNKGEGVKKTASSQENAEISE